MEPTKMPPDKVPYVKTLEDELDWKQLDQLHNVVSQISSFCFETKKFCVTTEFVVLTLIVKFTNDRLDHSLFVTGAIIALCFWFLDAVGYYYQTELRGSMNGIQKRLLERQETPPVDAKPGPIIPLTRVDVGRTKSVLRAAFNHSMWIYWFLLMIDAVVWALFCTEVITTNAK